MIEFIWNLQREQRIQAVESKANQARDDVARHKIRLEQLEFHVERMALASQAMWELLKERAGLTEPELLAKIAEIDLRDGARDQRMSPQMTTCPSCQRKLNTRSDRCLYCGAAVAKPHVFQ